MTLESIHHNKHSHLLFTQNTTWDKIQHISPNIYALMEYLNHLAHINAFVTPDPSVGFQKPRVNLSVN